MRGTDEEHLIARIELRVGPTMLVSLGDESRLDGFEDIAFDEGDTITFKARAGLIDGELGLIATQIRPPRDADTKLRAIHVNLDQRSPARMVRLEGQIRGFENRSIRGEEHVFVTLRTDEGNRRTVDLGSDDSVSELNLGLGDGVRIVEIPSRIKDQRVIRAGAIRYDNEWHYTDNTRRRD